MELMEFYAFEGMLDKAIEVSKETHGYGQNAALLNNAGNIHFKKDYDTAIKYYKEAFFVGTGRRRNLCKSREGVSEERIEERGRRGF